MPAHDDVADGLAELRDRGYRLVTLTNSPPVTRAPSPLERAGLGDFIERQFSVDTYRMFKPATRLYEQVAADLGAAPTES